MKMVFIYECIYFKTGLRGGYELKNTPQQFQTLPDGMGGCFGQLRYVLWQGRRPELKIFSCLREILVGVKTFRAFFEHFSKSQFFRKFSKFLELNFDFFRRDFHKPPPQASLKIYTFIQILQQKLKNIKIYQNYKKSS